MVTKYLWPRHLDSKWYIYASFLDAVWGFTIFVCMFDYSDLKCKNGNNQNCNNLSQHIFCFSKGFVIMQLFHPVLLESLTKYISLFWTVVALSKSRVLYMSFDRFLLAVESRDLSQADKSIIRVSSFSILQTFNFWIIKLYQKSVFGTKLMFWSILSFKNLQDGKVNTFLSFSSER